MKKLIFILFLVSLLVEAGDVKKWVDEKGNVHYGDRPPAGQSVEAVKVDTVPKSVIKRDKNFLFGKWRTDQIVYSGKTIGPLIHEFSRTSIKLEDNESMLLPVSNYFYSEGVVTVTFGDLSQKYTIVDENTVSYQSLWYGKQLLHRIN